MSEHNLVNRLFVNELIGIVIVMLAVLAGAIFIGRWMHDAFVNSIYEWADHLALVVAFGSIGFLTLYIGCWWFVQAIGLLRRSRDEQAAWMSGAAAIFFGYATAFWLERYDSLGFHQVMQSILLLLLLGSLVVAFVATVRFAKRRLS